MSLRRSHTILLSLVLLLASCQKENMGDCFKSTGKMVRDARDISRFDAIELDDRINLYLTYAAEIKLEVEAGKNIQELIRTEVNNGLLSIHNDNTCNWVRSYKKDINVYLSTPTLKGFTYYGSGEVRFMNEFVTDHFRLNTWEASGNLYLQLDCPDVELKTHTGPADVHCSGKTNKLVAYTNGLGQLNLVELKAKEVLAVNTNSGKLTVRSDSLLNANIDGDGNIYYVGTPNIQLRDNGEGQLIDLN